MPIQEFQLATFVDPPANPPIAYLTLTNFENQSNLFDVSVIDVIVSEFNANFFPLDDNYCYVCIWVLSLQRIDNADIPFKIFDGNPPRRNFGFYSLGRGNAIASDGLITYPTQTLPKSAFMFSNVRFNRTGGVTTIDPVSTQVSLYNGGTFSGFATQVVASAGALLGATRVRTKFAPGTIWNCQIQAQVTWANFSRTPAGLKVGDVL